MKIFGNISSISLNIALLVAIMFICFCGVVTAATDGTLGNTSQGTVDVTLKVQGGVLINRLQDIDLGTWTPGPGISGNKESSPMSFFVFSSLSVNYNIRFSSANSTDGKLNLDNGGEKIPYKIIFYGEENGGGTPHDVENQDGTVSGIVVSHDPATATAAKNASIKIVADIPDIAREGDYKDTLTFLISPD